MAIKYETGVVTFGQFISSSLLGFVNGATSIIGACHAGSTDCASNGFVTLLFILVEVLWFASLWILGFATQDRRSRRLARLLIVAEAGTAVVALFNAKHFTGILSLVTSLLDFGLALWVILLAWRISRAKGGRVVASHRARQRRRPISQDKL